MPFKLTRSKAVAGLECTNHGLRMAVVKPKRAVFVRSQEIYADSPDWYHGEGLDNMTEALKQAVRHQRLYGAGAVITLPNDQWLLRYMTFPVMPKEQLRQAIELELNVSIHLPFEDAVFDVASVQTLTDQTVEGEQTVAMIATSRDLVERLAGMAENAGLVPRAIEVLPLSVGRLLQQTEAITATLSYAVLYLDGTDVTISIFVGSSLYFHRQLGDLLSEVEESAHVHLSVRDLAVEINRVVDFFQHTLSSGARHVADLFLHIGITDSMSDDANPLETQLAEELPQLNVHKVDIEGVRRRRGLFPPFYPAVGMALKGARG
ncbi:type IV pilus biogenesis protein PilM [Alicyclobacillus sp. SO9]|uniref:type IV pilus biogenesis protein PilM n=1 Tax=Alicyclobacillus sp. SO9 TaxID=2665646 RepID=UPI0018E85FA3|nr:hypothetical protein [Alicyclobacillus sp. SO9]QQE77546.1 hypothetical protein GI364_16585 [Alicyclobacillus sp. SO9]